MTTTPTTNTKPQTLEEYIESGGKIDSGKRGGNIRTYLRNVAQVLTRVNRTLAGNGNIVVQRMDKSAYGHVPQSPAFSRVANGQVFIDFAHESYKGCRDDEHLVHTLGLNYHELSHLLFTPNIEGARRQTNPWFPMRQLILGDRMAQFAWNYLEDGRIERLMISRYGATRAYLTLTFLRMLDVSSNPEAAWFFVAPRLGEQPKAITDAVWHAIQAWPNRRYTDDELREVARIAREYKRLAFTNKRKINRATELVKRYAELLWQQLSTSEAQDQDQHAGDISGQSRSSQANRSDVDAGIEQVSPDEQQKAQDQRDKDEAKERQDRELDEELDAEEAAGDSEATGDVDDSDAESKGESKDKGATPAGETDDSADDNDDDDDDVDNGAYANVGGSAGSEGEGEDGEGYGESGSSVSDHDLDIPEGGGRGGAGSPREFDQAVDRLDRSINEGLADTLEDDQVQAEIASHRRALKGRASVSLAPKLVAGDSEPVTPEMRRAAKRVGSEFAKLFEGLKPGWERRTKHGKLNASRWVRERDPRTAFDKWRVGQTQAADVEIVILLDLSGSMVGEPVRQAAEMLWTLRSGLSSIDAKITALGFESDQHTLSEVNDRLSKTSYPVWDSLGGTNMTNAMESAAGVLQRSNATSRAVIVITDGDIEDGFEDTLNDLRAAGVHTSKFHIDTPVIFPGQRPWHYWNRLFDYNAKVNTALDVIEPVRAIVRSLIKSKVRSR